MAKSGGTKIRGIVVELGGDTSGLSKALSDVNGQIRNTQSQLKDVNRLLKLDPKNTDLLRQRQELLAKAVDETRGKLDALKDAEKLVQQQVKEGKASQEQYEALQREIVATEQALKDLESQAQNANTVLAQIGNTGEDIKKVGDKITGVGKTLAPVSAAATGAGVFIGKMASDFEDAMAKVSTIADETEMSMDDMEKAIMDLSNQTGISSAEIAGNVYDAISAGQKTGDAVNFVSNATKLAKAGFTSSASALDVLTTIMNAYGLSADEVTKVSDVLIQTQNLGKTTVDELASSMGKVIPTAKANGVSIENLASVYAVMTANGIATAETTTYMNSMLNELGKQGTSAADAFAKGTEHIKEGGLTMKEAMDMGWELTDVLSILDEQAAESGTSIANMFGSAEAGKAANVLWDNAEKVNDVVLQMGESAGATEEAFGKLDTRSYKIEKSINQVKNTSIELGQVLMERLAPVLDDLSAWIEQATQWFSSLDEETQSTIITIGLLVAAAAPVLMIIGNIVGGIGNLMVVLSKIGPMVTGVGNVFSSVFTFISANPIVLLMAAIAGLVVYIAKNGYEIQSILQRVDDFMQNIFAKDWTEVFGPVLGGALNAFFMNMKDIWDSVMLMLNGVIDFIRGVFTGDWERAWNGIKEIFGGVFQMLLPIAKAPLNGVISLINGMIDGINWVIRKANSLSFTNPFTGKRVGVVHLGEIGNIPYLAKGGILSQGSAVVGEAGPELLTMMGNRAVVQPLTNQTTNSNYLGGLTVNVYGAPGQDVGELADLVADKVQAAVQRQEAVFA